MPSLLQKQIILQACTVLKISILCLFCKERSKIANGRKKALKYPDSGFMLLMEKSSVDPVSAYVSFASQ